MNSERSLYRGMALACLAFLLNAKLLAAQTPCGCWIAATDDASQSIMVFDPAVTDWNSSSAVKYTWAPSASNGFTNPAEGWGLPADVKLRNYMGSQYIIVGDTDGFASVIPYPALTGKLWANNIGSAAGIHGVELMPDGNVAVAAASPGWVRIYAASQGTYNKTYFEYDLTAAHSVLWDPANQTLWAIGESNLLGFKYDGTPAAPHLTLAVTSPTFPVNPWGHYIAPVYYNTDRLWVSTNGNVMQYVKSTNSWDTSFTAPVNQTFVKSISNQPSGQTVETYPSSVCSNGWSTDTVSFYGPDSTRTRTGACFYRAIAFDPDYQ